MSNIELSSVNNIEFNSNTVSILIKGMLFLISYHYENEWKDQLTKVYYTIIKKGRNSMFLPPNFLSKLNNVHYSTII